MKSARLNQDIALGSFCLSMHCTYCMFYNHNNHPSYTNALNVQYSKCCYIKFGSSVCDEYYFIHASVICHHHRIQKKRENNCNFRIILIIVEPFFSVDISNTSRRRRRQRRRRKIVRLCQFSFVYVMYSFF